MFKTRCLSNYLMSCFPRNLKCSVKKLWERGTSFHCFLLFLISPSCFYILRAYLFVLVPSYPFSIIIVAKECYENRKSWEIKGQLMMTTSHINLECDAIIFYFNIQLVANLLLIQHHSSNMIGGLRDHFVVSRGVFISENTEYMSRCSTLICNITIQQLLGGSSD